LLHPVRGCDRSANERDQDYHQRYILPDGCVDFPGLQPYDGFIQWCQDNWIDLFVFGWDWRRGTEDTANFFLQTFLPAFESLVQECTPDPLQNFWLIGHSFGGLVVKQILNQPNNQYVQKMKGAVTVATPFYGYGGQVHRFFKGDSQLNWSVEPKGATNMTEIVSTLRAGYELLFFDMASYTPNSVAFAHDPDGYHLTSYPSMDAHTAGQPADPYNPIPGAGAAGDVRYLPTCGFQWKLLADGDAASRQFAQPLDPTISGLLWNIRGIQSNGGIAQNGTVVSQTWALVPPTFDPDTDDDPIADTHGPGDGVVPAWSARLLSNPNRVITVAGDLDHMDMMNAAAVQTEIAVLLHLQLTPQAQRRMRANARRATMETESRTKLNRLLEQLRAVPAGKEMPKRERQSSIRKVLRQFDGGDPNELQHLRPSLPGRSQESKPNFSGQTKAQSEVESDPAACQTMTQVKLTEQNREDAQQSRLRVAHLADGVSIYARRRLLI
jgi:pimeloyl-ACP methyl ester carboxylesterase